MRPRLEALLDRALLALLGPGMGLLAFVAEKQIDRITSPELERPSAESGGRAAPAQLQEQPRR